MKSGITSGLIVELCWNCGKPLNSASRGHFCGASCTIAYNRMHDTAATNGLLLADPPARQAERRCLWCARTFVGPIGFCPSCKESRPLGRRKSFIPMPVVEFASIMDTIPLDY